MACRVRVEPWQHPKKSDYSQRKVSDDRLNSVMFTDKILGCLIGQRTKWSVLKDLDQTNDIN